MTEAEIQAVVDRIVACIAAAPLESEPCGNFYVEEVFPADLYREMLARLPSDEVLDFIDHPDAVTHDGRVTRKLMDFTPRSLERLEAQDRPFWRDMTAVFTAPALQDATAEKFRPELEAQFGTHRPAMVTTPLLYRDFPGYRIGIHPDAPIKVATLQFYLPADESQIHLGTSFHQRTAEGFRDLKTNPFRPNSGYGFVRTEGSWHSVRQLGPGEAVRNSIALTLYHRGFQYRSQM